MTPIEREPLTDAAFDLAIARCTVAAGLTFACATVSEQLAPATRSALERLMDDDERTVYQTITDDSDRRCYAAARGLLRIELSLHLTLSPQDWEYVPRSGGAPEIRTPLGRIDNFRFSLSHTRGLVACAVADASSGPFGAVGIDVEWIRTVPPMEELAQNHLAPAELAALRALPPEQRPKRFFSLWALHQARQKVLAGQGPGSPPEEPVHFTFDEAGDKPLACAASGQPDPSSPWRYWLHALDDVHVLALAARQWQLLA